MVNCNELRKYCYDIIGAIHEVHNELGPGLNEYVYQEALQMQLTEDDIPFEREVTFHPMYHGKEMQATYRLDFLCKGDVIVECKAISNLGQEQRAQLFNYMRLSNAKVGILVNFANRYSEIERYYYDSDSREICSTDGSILRTYGEESGNERL